MDPHQTDAGFFVSDAVVRAPAEAVHGEKKMKEAFVSSSSLSSSSKKEFIRPPLVTHHSSLVTPADAEGDLRLWDDPRMIEAASMGAIELYAHAVTGTRLEPERGKWMFDIISRILAWCYVNAIKASVKKENESEVIYDDPNA